MASLCVAAALAVSGGAVFGQETTAAITGQPGYRELVWDGGDTLSVSDAMTVRVRRDGPTRVLVTGPAELVARIVLRRGHLGMTHSRNWRDHNWNNDRVEVEISGVSLDNVSVGGSGRVILGSLQRNSLRVRIAGSGSVEADGRVGHLDVRISGSGSARLSDMRAREGRLSVSGSGSISIDTIDSADLSVSGSGRIASAAIQTAEVSVSGSGQVRIDESPRKLSRSISGSGRLLVGGEIHIRRRS